MWWEEKEEAPKKVDTFVSAVWEVDPRSIHTVQQHLVQSVAMPARGANGAHNLLAFQPIRKISFSSCLNRSQGDYLAKSIYVTLVFRSTAVRPLKSRVALWRRVDFHRDWREEYRDNVREDERKRREGVRKGELERDIDSWNGERVGERRKGTEVRIILFLSQPFYIFFIFLFGIIINHIIIKNIFQ